MDIVVLRYPDSLSWTEIEGFLGCLSTARRNGILRKKSENDRINTLLSRLLMLSEIEKRTGIPQNKIEFTKGNLGKPYLKKSDLQFSLSHTKGAICVAFSNEGEIGVDTERINRKVRPELYKRIFSTDELAEIEKGANPIFFWVQKEAFLKRLGVGITRDLRGISAVNLPDTSAKQCGDIYIGISGRNHSDAIVSEIELQELLNRFITKLKP